MNKQSKQSKQMFIKGKKIKLDNFEMRSHALKQENTGERHLVRS